MRWCGTQVETPDPGRAPSTGGVDHTDLRLGTTIALTTIAFFNTSVGSSCSAPFPLHRFFNSC